MKKLEELGVSLPPWDTSKSDCGVWSVFDRNGQGCQFREADARLMAFAPHLYKALREAVIEACHDCDACDKPRYRKCRKADGACFVQQWRKVLEKAGGMK